MSAVMRRVRWVVIAALAIGYALLAHYTMASSDAKALGVLVALSPLLIGGFSLAWHSTRRLLMLCVFAICCGGLLAIKNTLEQHFGQLYWIEHAGTEMLLCLAFARTLRHGREPMCSYFARLVHGPLVPVMQRYTRQVTFAWVIFFGSMSILSTLLFYLTSLATWSAFANFFTAPLIALMFIAEYGMRLYLHPDFKHAHILTAIKTFWKAPSPP